MYTQRSLIRDLDQRGLLKDTLVLAFGEFGRTPKINKDAGRDHWGRAGSLASWHERSGARSSSRRPVSTTRCAATA